MGAVADVPLLEQIGPSAVAPGTRTHQVVLVLRPPTPPFLKQAATPKSPTFLLGDRPEVEFKGALPEVETDHAHRKATLFDLQLCRFCAHERGQ